MKRTKEDLFLHNRFEEKYVVLKLDSNYDWRTIIVLYCLETILDFSWFSNSYKWDLFFCYTMNPKD